MPLEFVEKDFWVVEVLRSVSRPLPDMELDEQPVVVFKGGTSLSKALRLTSRFSEDVDILVQPNREMGLGAIDKRILKPLVERVRVDLGLDEDRVEPDSYPTKGRKRNARYLYPTFHREGVLSPGVYLEMGVRGGVIPGLETFEIRSYIADYLAQTDQSGQFLEEQPCAVRVLSPVRTLAEKLSAVHTAACSDRVGLTMATMGRHYYDIHALLNSGTVVEEWRNCAWLEICADVQVTSERFGWDHEQRPDDGYANSPAFTREGQVYDAGHAAYDQARGLLFGRVPSYDEILDTIHQNGDML